MHVPSLLTFQWHDGRCVITLDLRVFVVLLKIILYIFFLYISERIVYPTIKNTKITRYQVENNECGWEKKYTRKSMKKVSLTLILCVMLHNNILHYFILPYIILRTIIPHPAQTSPLFLENEEKKEKNDSLSLISN